MKAADIFEKVKTLGRRAGMKTLIAVSAVLVLGCAVVLNVILQGNTEPTDDKNKMAIDLSKDDADQVSLDVNEVTDYFASITLQRQQARDEAMQVLLSVAESSTALEEAKQSALTDINRMALQIEQEANIESLVVSKGFSQCVAVIGNDNKCSVIVETNGLMPGEVAQISEIVYEQTGIIPENLNIIEKKTT